VRQARREPYPDSIESRSSWVAAAITTAILAISCGAPLLTRTQKARFPRFLVFGLREHGSVFPNWVKHLRFLARG
jgi:hypothetical protein